MKFLGNKNVEYFLSNKEDGPMNLVGHEYFDKERIINRHSFFRFTINNGWGLNSPTIMPKLSHGGRCEIVSIDNSSHGVVEADAIITDKKGLALTIGFADCPTIFLYDPISQVIGLVHGGWKSLVADIVKNTIGRMKNEMNSDPKNIQVFIGPGICAAHYEIGPEVAFKFGIYATSKMFFSLNDEIFVRLIHEGIEPANIKHNKECTYECEGKEKYYSWRRDRSDPLETNMAVMIMR